MKKKNSFSLPLFLLLSLFLMSCGEKQAEQKGTANLNNLEKKDNVILEIQGEFYFNSDFEKYVSLASGGDSAQLSAVSLSRLLDDFIDEKILLQAAKNKEISLTPEEQKQYLVMLSKESTKEGKNSSSKEMESKALLQRLLIDKYIFEIVKNIEAKAEEIKEYYDLHKKEFLRPERIRVSQILLETEEKAIEILEEVRNSSEEYFRKVARESSVGVEASRGGVMGLFEMNQLPFEMEKVIFSLEEGELSSVVESAYGYHIFRLDKRVKPELISFNEASPEIRVKILNQKIKQAVSQHIEDLKKELDWNFYPQNLNFLYQSNFHE